MPPEEAPTDGMVVAAVAVTFGLHRMEVTVPAVANPAVVAVLAVVPNAVVRSRAVPALGLVCVERKTRA